MNHVVKKGADPKKTIVGISTFGNQYTLDNYDDTTLGSPAKEHTYEKGWLPYSEVIIIYTYLPIGIFSR